MEFYAHIREDGKKQTVEEHLHGTAQLCSHFASSFGEAKRGLLLGYAHDIGKTSHEFQKRLQGGAKVDHATAGAIECAKINELLSACCVAGHHGGLPNYGSNADLEGASTLIGRIKKGLQKNIPNYYWNKSLPYPDAMPQFQDMFSYSLWGRMLYSCLVDADYLDTEKFMSVSPVERSNYDELPVLFERLNEYIRPWFPAKSELNKHRCDILNKCIKAADLPQGAYSLTVPTGGGKTVASLAFALKHAVEHGMDRVIYVIPYTSIIEQNAEVFRTILGDRNVLEHHSGVQMDSPGESSSENICHRLAAENWDAPVIVTTSVQFFESLYSNRPSQCRKLHNIANSVIIFDEAQMLPTYHLSPCVGVIANLTRYFNVSTVLCTATQPVLGDIVKSFCPDLSIREICPDIAPMYEKFRRVTYQDGGKLNTEALCRELSELEQVLCIVNTRKAAQRIFENLPEDGRFHLSTLMYPVHRKAVLAEIRKRLAQGLPCRLVSTSLIEAGVDVDFPAVYRELAGLDSIAQAAGRCNREGKLSADRSIVTYFEGEDSAPILQRINIGASKEALSGNRNPGDPETIHRYFTAWRSLIGSELDKSRAVEHLRKGISGCSLPFDTVAKNFHLIDQANCTVYIPVSEGVLLCQKLLDGSAGKIDYRLAGQYSVSVYEQHFNALLQGGDIQMLSESAAVLTNISLYNNCSGLSLEADTGKAEFI